MVKLRDLYNKDLSFSELAQNNKGKTISISGFMAPPLKAESPFFVLTKKPMAVCPFCETEADWPADIIAVYSAKNTKMMPFNVPLIVTGTLELGDYVDPDLKFFSRVRLTNAAYKKQ